jgi:hypothetical protein
MRGLSDELDNELLNLDLLVEAEGITLRGLVNIT